MCPLLRVLLRGLFVRGECEREAGVGHRQLQQAQAELAQRAAQRAQLGELERVCATHRRTWYTH